MKQWITPGRVKADDWTFRDIRFYGVSMAVLGIILGFLIELKF